jgi:hypothetical protein
MLFDKYVKKIVCVCVCVLQYYTQFLKRSCMIHSMEGPREYYTKWNKPQTKENITQFYLQVKFLKKLK